MVLTCFHVPVGRSIFGRQRRTAQCGAPFDLFLGDHDVMLECIVLYCREREEMDCNRYMLSKTQQPNESGRNSTTANGDADDVVDSARPSETVSHAFSTNHNASISNLRTLATYRQTTSECF